MVNAYDVLGVGADAGRGEIRTAYVNLAKRLHPDSNAGSDNNEQQLREINQAYELLKDPERRSQYDQMLQQSQGQACRRRRHAAAVMAASFVLTAMAVATVLLLVRFSLLDATVQASGGSEMITTAREESMAFGSASLGTAAELGVEPKQQQPS